MSCVITMGEIESSNVQTSIDHFDEHWSIPTGWTKGANNLSLSHLSVEGSEDLIDFHCVF